MNERKLLGFLCFTVVFILFCIVSLPLLIKVIGTSIGRIVYLILVFVCIILALRIRFLMREFEI